jgi:branched-chain amino acid transport system substrate-binding protein
MRKTPALPKPLFRLVAAMLVTAQLASPAAYAQLVLGHISSYTGAFSARVKENAEGAEAYLKRLNAAGGVNGQKIELKRLDDNNDPAKAADLTKSFVAEKNAIAVFMPGGTPNTDALAKVTDAADFPVIAPSTGAMIFHTPVRKSVFNLRAPYQLEAEKMVGFVKELGFTKLAVLYDNSSFGKDVIPGALRGFEITKNKPMVVASFDRNAPNFDEVLKAMKGIDVEMILFIGASTHATEVFKRAHALNPRVKLATISNNASGGFIKGLGDLARGVYVSQVMPSENSSALLIQEMATHYPGGRAAMTPAIIEGYVAAKLAVEAIRLAGKNPTPTKVRAALEGMNNYDLGGLVVSYSPTDHTGFEFTDLSIISRTGNFFR